MTQPSDRRILTTIVALANDGGSTTLAELSSVLHMQHAHVRNRIAGYVRVGLCAREGDEIRVTSKGTGIVDGPMQRRAS